MENYDECVKATADILQIAGYNAVHIMPENIVQVTIDGEILYVKTINDVAKYKSKLVKHKYSKDYYHRIILRFENSNSCIISLSADTVSIHERCYKKDPLKQSNCKGSLLGTRYLDCENDVWVDQHYVLYISVGRLFDQLREDPAGILNYNFKPVIAYDVDIFNEDHGGNKVVKCAVIDYGMNNSDIFTLFIENTSYVIDGNYTYTGRADLFKYKNEEGELFAFLKDAKTATLTSNRQSIILSNIYDTRLKDKDGLYGGYIINQAGLDLSLYTEKHDEDGQFDGYYPLHIFKYKDTIFTVDRKNNKIIKLDARMPNGGSHTKPAFTRLE